MNFTECIVEDAALSWFGNMERKAPLTKLLSGELRVPTAAKLVELHA